MIVGSIDTYADVSSCGGCLSTGAGKDCSKIPHAISPSCMGGGCYGALLDSFNSVFFDTEVMLQSRNAFQDTNPQPMRPLA